MGISTHILDATRGRPVEGIAVALDQLRAGRWEVVAEQSTDLDGRAPALLPRESPPPVGVYRLRFATGAYFDSIGVEGLYPSVEICFEVRDGEQHCHLPLLLTANSYTTYRGS